MAIYFKGEVDDATDKLTQKEHDVKRRSERIKERLVGIAEVDKKGYIQQLDFINERVSTAIQLREELLQKEHDEAYAEFTQSTDRLGEEPITTDTQKERLKQVNLEVKFGLNTLSKVGMLLIIIGILSLLQYTYTSFLTPELKGLSGLLLGGVALVCGYMSYTKSKSVLGATFTGGGIAILYGTIFWSCFSLQIISLAIAFGLAVVVSALAFILSTKYYSKTIACFGLIGGYLPIYYFVLSTSDPQLIPCIVYVLLLNAVTFAIAYKRGWSVLDYLVSLMHFPILILFVFSFQTVAIPLLYTAIWIVMYTGTTLVYPIRHELRLSIAKILLLVFNIFVSCSVTHSLLIIEGYRDYLGMLSLAFAIVYCLLTYLLRIHAPHEKRGALIFSLTALTFVVLTIPFQFGLEWLALGWLVESALFIGFRRKLKSTAITVGSYIIYGLSVVSVGFDFLMNLFIGRIGYDLAAPEINVTILLILSWWLLYEEYSKHHIDPLKTILVKFYKYCVMAYTPIALSFVLIRLNYILTPEDVIRAGGNFNGIGMGYLSTIDVAIAFILSGFILNRIPFIKSRGVAMLSVIYYFIANLCVVSSNEIVYVSDETFLPALILMFIFNGAAIATFYQSVRYIVFKTKAVKDIVIIISTIYSLLVVTRVSFILFDFEALSLLLSILYLVSALVLIFIGFNKRQRFIRYFGLLLTLISTGKLFLIDISYYIPNYRIMAYFGFGVLLLGISYVYQYFSKMLISEIEDTDLINTPIDMTHTDYSEDISKALEELEKDLEDMSNQDTNKPKIPPKEMEQKSDKEDNDHENS